MSASPIDLCTVADVKSYMGSTDTTLDTLIQTLITACSQYFATYCSRIFQFATYTFEVYDGTGGNVLVLRNGPVTSVSAVVVNGVSYPAATGQLSNGYRYDDFAVYLTNTISSGFTCGLQNVFITYSAGYSVIPADLSNACVETVVKRIRDKDKLGVGSRSIAGESISFGNADMTPMVRSVVGLYRAAAPA